MPLELPPLDTAPPTPRVGPRQLIGAPDKTALEIARAIIKQRPDRKEIATLGVMGRLHTDWTSIRVEARAAEPYPRFQFETSEESPVPSQWKALQFLPGDQCTIWLGGQVAVVGYIDERHVSFDSRNHAVRLLGSGASRDIERSSVSPEMLEAKHDGKTWHQLAQDLSREFGVDVTTFGAVSPLPFKRVGIQPGETVMQVIERHARHRNIVIGSNFDGSLMGIGTNVATPLGELTEGVHILKANAVIRDKYLVDRIIAQGQEPGGSSGTYGTGNNRQRCERRGTMSRPLVRLVPTEISDDNEGICKRRDMEYVFTQGTEIEANITVQGWFKDNNASDALWRPNESYVVHSPMLALDNALLACASCIYEQNEGGTLTTLQMVTPAMLNKVVVDVTKNIQNLERARQQRLQQQQQQGAP